MKGLFKMAVSIVARKEEIQNLKSEIYSQNLSLKEQKYLYKIVIESLKFSKIYLKELESRLPSLKLKREEIIVYLWEFLLGSKKLLTKEISKNKTRIQAEFTRVKMNSTIVPESFKFARINSLKTSKEEVLAHFKSRGIIKFIVQDETFSFLLKVNSKMNLSRDEFYLNGKVVFQDKACCFSAHVLLQNSGDWTNVSVIDATAAPGNKTSHLAMIMGNKGRIYAFERDAKRFKLLECMLKKAGVENTISFNKDFLTVHPHEYADVEYILLDPSCSGSGIMSRYEFQDSAKADSPKRLESLSNFQKEIILHAFKFPSVKRVVYSTCSIYREENEDVVKYILENQSDFELEENMFPEWKRRGFDSTSFDKGIIYSFKI
jgi:putative methyltransferase